VEGESRKVAPAGPRGGRRGLLLGSAALLLLAFAMAATSSPVAAGDPPVANINAPANNTAWEAGKPITFSAVLSFDPDQNLTTYPMYYKWEFPNETIEGVDVKLFNFTNFTQTGTYTVHLTVTDEELLEGHDNVTVHIVPLNQLPVAVIASPADGSSFFTTDFIAFSGQGSVDPEGGPLAYTWFVDGAGQLGTGENLSVKLPAGQHVVTLRVQDDRGAEGTASITLNTSVNTPPRLDDPGVSPANGTAGAVCSFAVTYFEDNGEQAESVLLVLDGSTYPMVRLGSGSPVLGVAYGLDLAPPAGAHSFYMIASDGNLTNVSRVVAGPTLWEHLKVLSADGLGSLEADVVPPANASFAVAAGSLPGAPGDLVALSPPYAIQVAAENMTAASVSLSFAYLPGAVRASAGAYGLAPNGSAWVGLVSAVDASRGTVRLLVEPSALPLTVQVFAQRSTAGPDAPPSLALGYAGTTEPNRSVTFSAAGSSDPEGATLTFWWRFAGPGVETGWVSGDQVEVSFPQEGTYTVSLRGEDGAGNVAFRNDSVLIQSPEVPQITPPDEGMVIASLAVAVAVSAVLAVWWRSRTPKPTRTYDDLYGRAYKERMWDEREYAELFHKFADIPEAPDRKDPGGPPGD
jgi:hypothetical protein